MAEDGEQRQGYEREREYGSRIFKLRLGTRTRTEGLSAELRASLCSMQKPFFLCCITRQRNVGNNNIPPSVLDEFLELKPVYMLGRKKIEMFVSFGSARLEGRSRADARTYSG